MRQQILKQIQDTMYLKGTNKEIEDAYALRIIDITLKKVLAEIDKGIKSGHETKSEFAIGWATALATIKSKITGETKE